MRVSIRASSFSSVMAVSRLISTSRASRPRISANSRPRSKGLTSTLPCILSSWPCGVMALLGVASVGGEVGLQFVLRGLPGLVEHRPLVDRGVALLRLAGGHQGAGLLRQVEGVGELAGDGLRQGQVARGMGTVQLLEQRADRVDQDG